MKKIFCLILTSIVLLTGCSQKQTVDNPYEILVDNEIFSYYDTIEDIPEMFSVLDTSVENIINYRKDANQSNIFVDPDGVIRSISIVDDSVVTYKQISVGDNISKIEENYSYINKQHTYYAVLLNGNTEVDPAEPNKEDNWILISYNIEDSKITRITISDAKFAHELR